MNRCTRNGRCGDPIDFPYTEYCMLPHGHTGEHYTGSGAQVVAFFIGMFGTLAGIVACVAVSGLCPGGVFGVFAGFGALLGGFGAARWEERRMVGRIDARVS